MKKNILFFVFLSLILFSCKNNSVPKPREYFRIDYPEKSYTKYESDCPFTFQIPTYAQVVPDNSKDAQPCWLNVDYLPFNAELHLSFKTFENDEGLYDLVDDSRTFVYKHTVKAEGIFEEHIKSTTNAYGKYYDIEGNTATAIQFYLTDSTEKFIRGSLYFNSKINRDSLQPVIDFLETDIRKMIETFEWKKNS